MVGGSSFFGSANVSDRQMSDRQMSWIRKCLRSANVLQLSIFGKCLGSANVLDRQKSRIGIGPKRQRSDQQRSNQQMSKSANVAPQKSDRQKSNRQKSVLRFGLDWNTYTLIFTAAPQGLSRNAPTSFLLLLCYVVMLAFRF